MDHLCPKNTHGDTLGRTTSITAALREITMDIISEWRRLPATRECR